MKKFTFFTCVVCLVCMLFLAGCGTNDKEKTSDAKNGKDGKTVEQTVTPTEGDVTPAIDDGNTGVDSTPVPPTPTVDPVSNLTADEDAIYDSIVAAQFQLVNPDDVIIETENFRVTYLGLKYTPEAIEAEFQFLVENLSETEKVNFSSGIIMLNGWGATGENGSGIVAPGDRAVPSLTVNCNELIERGITTIDKSMFWFAASRMHAATSTFAYCETYPTGLTSEEIIIPERRNEKNEKVIIDNKFLKYVILNTEYNANDEFVINLYIENKTKGFMNVGAKKTCLNGIEIYALGNETLGPYTRNYTAIRVYKNKLEEKDITSVSDIDILIRCTDDHYPAKLYFERQYSYKVPQ